VAFLATVMGLFGSGKCKSKATLEGKTALITGANTGIGYETAKEFLKRGKSSLCNIAIVLIGYNPAWQVRESLWLAGICN
jgi:uncharacterized membrane protein (UPF0136 family)